MATHPLILLLRPQEHWGITAAELKRVDAYGTYMNVTGTVRAEWLDEDIQEGLRLLATLCEELERPRLFTRYANRKLYRRESDFWQSDDKSLQRYIKQMADQKLAKAIRQADTLGIPILYAANGKSALHMSDRLRIDTDTPVTPIMHFRRHDEGTTYQLQLRVGERLIESLQAHHTTVLTRQPGLCIIDGMIYAMSEGFSAQLLLPFLHKPAVEIPRRMENDYFRRFILKNVAKAEIIADGFDIEDQPETPRPRLTTETAVDGQHILSLCFAYAHNTYTPDSHLPGRVSLRATDDSFVFTRQLRDKNLEHHYFELLRQTGARPTASGIVRYDSLADMIAWLQTYGPSLRHKGFDVIQPSEHVYYIGPLSVEQSDTWHGDWLQTDVTVVLDDGRLRVPFRDLRDTILQGEQEYMLPTGERLLIPEEWLSRYADLLLTGMPKGNGFQRHICQVPPAAHALMDRSKGAAPAAGTASDVTVPQKLNATLRPYQKTGFEWLWHNFMVSTGCCLSDEMGLGKTLQTIALLLKYKEMSKPAPKAIQPKPGFLFTEEEMTGTTDTKADDTGYPTYRTSLVVAPASVVHNWHNELSRFAPTLQVCDYTGDTGKRREKRDNLMRWDVVLTTYRTLLNDISFLSAQQFGIIIYDESQAFKTHTSQIHRAVEEMQGHIHIALSGTPVENNLNELWSLMNVLNPNLLGDLRHFQQAFVSPISRQMESSRTTVLRRLIAPYFLKRTKEEVLSDLPERQDEVIVCPMSETQASLYATELSRARNKWMDSSLPTAQRQIHMLAAIQRLRQIANGEGKMEVIFERLESLRDTKHKVLIFSEYVSMLEQVGKEMQQRGWTHDLLTGATTHREQVIQHFQQTTDCQFFLISLKAGGVGINLTAADYVLLLDPWWNQATEEQAIARSHRIGQHHPVFVYRFVSEGTLEQQILTLQERKQSLIDSVMPFITR